MESTYKSIIDGNILKLDLLKGLLQKPEIFTQGEELFWNDSHISKGMLEAHLNHNTDAASRMPKTIEKTVKNLIDIINLKVDSDLLDLGCGPGLYSKLFAQQGINVTGVDYSKRSIEYAVQDAYRNSLNIKYEYMNYLEMDFFNKFDAVLLIYGDFCVLSNKDRDLLLKKVYKSLKTGGYFAFDVTTRVHREKNGLKNGWYFSDRGFWKPGPHLVLENGFDYPEESIYLDQYIVIEESGKVAVYRNWYHDYSLEEISDVLKNNGFTLEKSWSNLTGEPYKDYGEWIGLLARKE